MGEAVDGRDERGRRTGEPRARSAAEWTTLGVSLVVVLGLVALALVEHFGFEEPPGVRVAVALAPAAAEARDGVYYVPFRVTNQGSEAATDVGIHFEVRRGEAVVEESEAVVPFLPVGGSAEGELATGLDPATHDLVARVGTLLDP